MVRLKEHPARKRAAQQRKKRRSVRCAWVERGECALKLREEAWRHAGSTRNEGPEDMQASAADLPFDDKRCHSPLLLQNQRQHDVCQILASSSTSSAMRV